MTEFGEALPSLVHEGSPNLRDHTGPVYREQYQWQDPNRDIWMARAEAAIRDMAASDAQAILNSSRPRVWMELTGLPRLVDRNNWPSHLRAALERRAAGRQVAFANPYASTHDVA